jgi:hypothetical protein
VENEARNPPGSCTNKSDEKSDEGNEEVSILAAECESRSEDWTTRPVRPYTQVHVVLSRLGRVCAQADIHLELLRLGIFWI